VPHYDYGCNHCGFKQQDLYQSINDKPYKKCPKCKKPTFERLISGGLTAFVVQEPSTVGQLAARNTKKNKSQIEEAAAKKRETEPQQPDVSYRKKINKMTPEQKHKYIMEGD
jgi:putative FmdB family regulatory protein